MVASSSAGAARARGCPTVPNTEFCCRSPADCAAAGVDDDERRCADGYTCHAEIHTCIAAPCGNGILDASEVCDDGNNADGDGCSPKCTEPACFVPVTHASIQAAIDDASCAAVYVSSGTYAENVSIARDVSVIGVGAMPIVIDGQARASVVTIAAGTVALDRLTLTNGAAPQGGGIANHGALTLTDMRVESNLAISRGGGVFSDGPSLALVSTTIAGNRVVFEAGAAMPVASGGGIDNVAGTLAISGGSIEGNTIRATGRVDGLVASGAGLASSGLDVTISGTSIETNSIELDGTPGVSMVRGGGVHLASGHLRLTDAEVTDNRVSNAAGTQGDAIGGGVDAVDATITDATIAGNAATVSCADRCRSKGGGVYLSGAGASVVAGTAITGNALTTTSQTEASQALGAGLAAEGLGDVTVRDGAISNNAITANGPELLGSGGGVYWKPSQVGTTGKLIVIRTTVSTNTISSGNSAGGGIASDVQSGGHQIQIDQCTVDRNALTSAENALGAGIYLNARQPNGINKLGIASTTVSGNTIQIPTTGLASGAGVAMLSSLDNITVVAIASSTIARNSATGGSAQTSSGGLYGERARITVKNSIVADNGGLTRDCLGTIASSIFSLYGSLTGCTITSGSNDKVGVDARLAPLGDNGGPTLTHALLAGSAAVDAAEPSGCTDDVGGLLILDQRGQPRIANGRCDIVAFER